MRKNISISKADYEQIYSYSQKIGMSFSELIRVSTLKAIKQAENISLLEFLNSNCSFVDDEEEQEIKAKVNSINFDDEGVEITLNELL